MSCLVEKANPYICEEAIEHDYYLLPRAKRTKGFRRRRRPLTPTPTVECPSQNKSLKLKISLKRKTIERVHNQEASSSTTDYSLVTKHMDNRVNIERINHRNGEEIFCMEKTDTTSLVEKRFKKRVRIGTLFDQKQSKLEERKEKRKKSEPTLEPPSLPDEFKEKISRMGVPISQVSLVIQKVLYDTDLSHKHMRMSIPVKQVRNEDFLSPQQKMELERRDESNKKIKILFNLIEPSLHETKIHLAKWDMNNSSSYVLLNDWIEVVERNKLKSGMVVQLWSFRQDLVPWLALVLVPPAVLEASQTAMEG